MDDNNKNFDVFERMDELGLDMLNLIVWINKGKGEGEETSIENRTKMINESDDDSYEYRVTPHYESIKSGDESSTSPIYSPKYKNHFLEGQFNFPLGLCENEP